MKTAVKILKAKKRIEGLWHKTSLCKSEVEKTLLQKELQAELFKAVDLFTSSFFKEKEEFAYKVADLAQAYSLPERFITNLYKALIFDGKLYVMKAKKGLYYVKFVFKKDPKVKAALTLYKGKEVEAFRFYVEVSYLRSAVTNALVKDLTDEEVKRLCLER